MVSKTPEPSRICGSLPVAILCIGHVEEFTEKPLLETAGWDSRRELSGIISENSW